MEDDAITNEYMYGIATENVAIAIQETLAKLLGLGISEGDSLGCITRVLIISVAHTCHMATGTDEQSVQFRLLQTLNEFKPDRLN